MPLATERAPAKINLCLFLGGTRADGRHELVTLFDSVGLCDELRSHGGTGRRGGLRGGERAQPGRRRARRPARGRLGRAAGAGRDRQAHPGRGGHGRRLGRRGGDAALRAAAGARRPRRLRAIAAGLGADVPGQLRPAPSLGTGAGEVVAAAAGADALRRARAAPAVRALDRRRLPRGRPARAGALRRRAGGAAAPAIAAALEPGAGRQRPAARGASLAPAIAATLAAAREAGADHALVCGSGPTVIGLFWGATAGAARARGRRTGPGRDRRRAGRRRGRLAGAEATEGNPQFAPVRGPRCRGPIPGFRHNWGPRVSNQSVTYLVGGGSAVIVLVAFGTLVLVPAVTSYRRPLHRVGAVVLSLYVLAAFVGIGVLLGALIILEWPRLF